MLKLFQDDAIPTIKKPSDYEGFLIVNANVINSFIIRFF